MDKTLKKQRLIICGLTTGMIISLAASLCGTFAWYTYGSRAPLFYDGTSIGSGVSVELGVESEVTLPKYKDYGLTEDTSVSGTTIYWASSTMTAEALSYVLENNGSATNALRPVTPGKHTTDNPVNLYNGPEHRVTQNDPYYLNAVTKNRFADMPLVFRYKPANSNAYVSDYKVYLAAAVPNSYTTIKKGIRMLFNGLDEENHPYQHLIDPNNSELTTVKVGGPLDLDVDGYYDTYGGGDFLDYEIGYGQYVSGVYHKLNPVEADSDIPDEELTTFYAKHKEGTVAIDDNYSQPEVCEYEGTASYLNKTIALAYPQASKNNYAFLDVNIFLEGWDPSIINANVGALFSLDLSFEVLYDGA